MRTTARPVACSAIADRVIPAFRDAVARGVIVDLGHGSDSFSFRVCETALAQGMPVHCISSDLQRGNLGRDVFSLARTMSKLRAIGLSLMEVVRAVTIAPARAAAIDGRGFGRLEVGKPARLTLFHENRRTVDARGRGGRDADRAGADRDAGVLLGETYHERSQGL